MLLARFSVSQPVLVNLLMVFVLVAGIAGFARLPKEMFPVIQFEIVQVHTVYPGVAPGDVEELITIPVENAVRGIDGLDRLTSTSVEGRSIVLLQFLPDERDMQEVLLDVRTEVNKAKAEFPEDAEDPEVSLIAQDIPVIMAVVSGPVSEPALRRAADDLEDQLLLVDGVGSIGVAGARKREVTVQVDPERLRAHGLGFQDVERALARANVNLPLGTMKTDREEVLLRILGAFDIDDAEALRQVIVGSDARGRHLRLAEVATIDTSYEEARQFARAGGHRAITLDIRKKDDADTLAVTARVRRLIDEFRATLPQTVQVELVRDSSIWVERRLATMYQSGAIGLVLVLGLLLLFLNVRIALITALGLPFAFLGAVLVMAFAGVSFNMIVMFGFIVVLGMIVDDAIVIVENCYRYLEQGRSPREAALRGASEVAGPVIAAVITTMAAFAPLLFIKGLMGKFMLYVPLAVIIALACSLVEALIVVPCHVADWARPLAPAARRHAGTGWRAGARRRFQAWFGKFLSWYAFLLARALRRRYLVVAASVLLLVGSLVYSVLVLGWEFMSIPDSEIIQLELETPTGTKIEETARAVDELSAKVRAELRPGDELKSLTAAIGVRGLQHDRKAGSNVGQIMLEMPHRSQRGPQGRSSAAVERALRAVGRTVDNLTYFEVKPMQGGPPTGSAISVRLRGEDIDTLLRLAREFKAWLQAQPGVVDVHDDMEGSRREYHLRVDRDRAAAYGLSDLEVAQAVRTAFAGRQATEVQQSEDEVRVVVQLDEAFRRDLSDLESFEVPLPTGGTTTLNAVARLEVARGNNQIRRYNQKRTVTITAEKAKDADLQPTQVMTALRRRFEAGSGGGFASDWNVAGAPGYTASFAGEFEMTQDLFDSLAVGFPIALLLIYLILAAQFQSYVQPVIVMTAIPFGIIGVIVGFGVLGMKMGFLGVIGVVALSGIVVNDSLVLVDFINRARAAGADRWSAIMKSGKIRMRPILLTTLTTIGGLGPMAAGLGGADSEFLAPMAIAICWGLAFATALTLIFVPCAYAVLDDARTALRRGWRWLSTDDPGAAGVPVGAAPAHSEPPAADQAPARPPAAPTPTDHS